MPRKTPPSEPISASRGTSAGVGIVLSELERIQALRDGGMLSAGEAQALKARLLGEA